MSRGARLRRSQQDETKIEVVELGLQKLLLVSWDVPPARATLTVTDRALLRLLAEGKSDAGIAKARGRSPRTIANQIASLLRRLGVRSRHELAALAPPPEGGEIVSARRSV